MFSSIAILSKKDGNIHLYINNFIDEYVVSLQKNDVTEFVMYLSYILIVIMKMFFSKR